MKTTIDLPDSLALRLKITAARRGERVKTLAVWTLRAAMAEAGAAPRRATRGKIVLPLFPCAADAPARRMSLKALLALEQKTLTQGIR